MDAVYVAGPVIRVGKTEPEWALNVYNEVQTAGLGRRVELRLPKAEPALEHAPPAAFLAEIERRISTSAAVIGVYAREISSGPIEISMAGMLKKPLLVLAKEPAQVPRLIAGFPGTRVAGLDKVGEEVRSFLDLVAPSAVAAV